ncbi:Pectate lyase [Dillenia turbinata]|uniref:Pectate lyase n=1 Tax=Dillenia turbinata TaxID=194707 RepID=A0AAN8YZF5_9MAGN
MFTLLTGQDLLCSIRRMCSSIAFVLFFGASDSNSKDQVMQITVAYNHFGKGLVQRMPRWRWGFFHVVNNDDIPWLVYAIGGSQHPTITSQGNRFTAADNTEAKEVTKRDHAPEREWNGSTWRSEGDLLRNGAFFTESEVQAIIWQRKIR